MVGAEGYMDVGNHLTISNNRSICSGSGNWPLNSSGNVVTIRYDATPIGFLDSLSVYSTIVRSLDLQMMIPIEGFSPSILTLSFKGLPRNNMTNFTVGNPCICEIGKTLNNN